MLTFDEATLAEKVPDLAGRREAERLLNAFMATPLDEDASAAEAAYMEHPCELLLTDDGDTAEHCALSGLPILADDELLTDGDGLEMVLRCLVLPPHPVALAPIEAADQPDDEVVA